MASMLKVKARWSGFVGSPGWTNFYFRLDDGDFHTQQTATDAAARVSTFFTAVKDKFTTAVTVSIQPDVEVIEDTTGEMTSVFGITTPAAIVGSNTIATFSGPTGAVVTWRTNSVHNGRRVRGRTFLVPTSTAVFQNDGTLDTAHRTALQTAADALASATGSPDLGIWARPKKLPDGTVTAPGAWYPVSSATVPDLAAVLRSRRD